MNLDVIEKPRVVGVDGLFEGPKWLRRLRTFAEHDLATDMGTELIVPRASSPPGPA